MIKIPENYYTSRLEKIRSLFGKHNLDCLLIYNAEKEDPAFLPWILGENIFDSTYLLITKKGAFIFIPQWFIEEAKNLFKNIPAEFIGTPEKATMMLTIKSYLQNFEIIGYAGNAPYKELVLLAEKKLVNMEEDIRKIYEIKDEVEIKLLGEVCNYTRNYLENLKIKQFIGKTEQEIAKQIQQETESDGYNLGHLSIVSGQRLQKTTAGFPSDYKIQKNDLVCVDLGLEKQTYFSDITRCYFLGDAEKKYRLNYDLLKSVVSNTSQIITRGIQSKDILGIIRNEFIKTGLTEDSFVPADLGHGIGTGRHEYPEIGFDESILEKGMVFTLEPEAKLSDGMLVRYEDVFYINQEEKTLII
ncbi:MAG: aminopeptidase P family protein [Candidatus Yanofskybacteria bacterium]|nr:aminopeptidase P family protein [Candidatus Yanofskybacteria bacterium]